jgi:hypothetical protein
LFARGKKRLEMMCGDYPRKVAGIVEILLKDERQVWQPLMWKAQVESVLRALLATSDETAPIRITRIAQE